MYAKLSSRRGGSQVLFLGIVSPHIYSITLRLPRGVSVKLSEFRVASFPSTSKFSVCWDRYEHMEYKASKATPFCTTMPTLSGLCLPPQALSARTHFKIPTRRVSKGVSLCRYRRKSDETMDMFNMDMFNIILHASCTNAAPFRTGTWDSLRIG